MIYSLDCFFFFFKQKTAYEMRISDWSSDVCSSDLRVHATGDQAGDVGRIEHEQRADLVGDLTERRRVDDPRVRGGARDDDLRAVLERRVAHLVEVDALVARGAAVGADGVKLAARVERLAVGEVPALVEAQPEPGVAGPRQRRVGGHQSPKRRAGK